MESWIVSYDISDPKRLRRVATACEDFGVRKQLSVFLCRVSGGLLPVSWSTRNGSPLNIR